METSDERELSAVKEFGGEPFVRIPRALINGPFGQEKRIFSKFEACVDLIQMARYSDNEKKEYIAGKLITWGQGQIGASFRFLALRWKWSNDKVKRFLDLSVSEKRLLIDTNQGLMVITVLDETSRTGVAEKTEQQQVQRTEQQQVQPNPIPDSIPSIWPNADKYTEPNANPNSNRTATSTKQKEGRNKDVKKDSNNEIQYAFGDLEFKQVFDEWIKYRKQIKKPLTAISIEKQTAELKNETIENAIAILNQSMTKGWIGLQPLKTQENGKSNAGGTEKQLAAVNY